ncbi:MAG TPA: serine/threonine-protein kinase [Pirellulales bacterium]|nr:serine/threonine-protein kinase [Pirellulales bacterium]
MDVTTAQHFITLLHKSRLLSEEQLAETARELAADPDRPPADWAQELVARGWLTDWQSKQLLNGRYAFFMGKYKLLERLGGGGMGVVFTAHHAMTDRVVALKVMNKTVLSNPLAMKRFQAEVRLLCAVSHPNIIGAYDADCAGGMHFLVMEYGRGQDLRVWLRQHPQLPIDWVCDCIRQAALGLEHAHQRGLVHRDIKPENLLVEDPEPWSRPQVKILDLGLARWMGDEAPDEAALRVPGQIMGTVDYIAPEQVEQTDLADVRSDIFSLGCTLFKCLTGALPYEGETSSEKLLARVSQDARLASSVRPEIPEQLDRIVAKMLCRDPEERYQSPAEIANALFPLTADGKLAKPTPPPPPPIASASPQPAVAPTAPIAPTSAPGDHALGSFLSQLSQDERPAAPDMALPTPAAALNESPTPSLENLAPQASAAVVFEPDSFPAPAAEPVPPRKRVSAASVRPVSGPAAPAKNWALGIGVGVAISVPVLALLFWIMRPAQLVLHWPTDQRSGSRLDVDGEQVAIPSADPAKISLPPGKHRIVLRRRGYDQLEWNLSFARGDRVEQQVEWKTQELGQSFGFGLGKSP